MFSALTVFSLGEKPQNKKKIKKKPKGVKGKRGKQAEKEKER